MNEPFTVASATEYYDFSKLEKVEAARENLDIAKNEFMLLAQAMLAERRLGHDVAAFLPALEGLCQSKLRAEEAFRAAHE